MLPTLLFAAAAALIVVAWNRWFARVDWRVALLFVALPLLYEAPVLLTNRTVIPGNLAFVAQPWMATGAPQAKANTGIIFTQIAPWTRVARESLAQGTLPLWNRFSASGAPLLANQQTAIFHPFTLLGLPLDIGDAFTLSALLRLFVLLFFTFVFLRDWELRTEAAIAGAVAYAFSSFHIVWLLFPLGLATMMLPLCLAGVQQFVRRPRPAAYAMMTIGLSLSVLGGHPESALWVWIATVAFTLYATRNVKQIALIATAFLAAMALTAWFWLPTLRALEVTSRMHAFRSSEANPADHGLSAEWLLPFLAQNALGNPVDGTYTPPRGSHPAVLNDYGEVASSYAGLLTLALAFAAPFVARRRPLLFALALMLFSFLTVAEAPLWRDGVRAIPLAGISLHQRLRVFWNLGVAIAAALTLDAVARGASRRALVYAAAVAGAAFGAVYVLRQPVLGGLGRVQCAVPLLMLALFLVIAFWRRAALTVAATALILIDLVVATWNYNPPATREHLYPVTGAIAALQQVPRPARFVALGWSFLPDTPGFYGLEDVKTTDPVAHATYLHLLRGHLDVEPGNYDLLVRNVSNPFFDFLNIRHVYAPPGQTIADPTFVLRYNGADGAVYENTQALPRYFLPTDLTVERDAGRTIWLTTQVSDFGRGAVVDRVTARAQADGIPANGSMQLGSGTVRIVSYERNRTVLEVESRGWNLLASSDVAWPGWRITHNDGKAEDPVVVNGAFLGTFVAPGRSRVVLEYRPKELVLGGYLAAAALILLMFALLVVRRSQRIVTSKRGKFCLSSLHRVDAAA